MANIKIKKKNGLIVEYISEYPLTGAMHILGELCDITDKSSSFILYDNFIDFVSAITELELTEVLILQGIKESDLKSINLIMRQNAYLKYSHGGMYTIYQ